MANEGKIQVLVADDDAVTRRILEACLKDLGYLFLLARDGHEAWAQFQRSKVDVIISDWLMPGINGLDLCRQVRAATAPYTYFILLTSNSDKEQFLEGMRAGADDYLVKPLHKDELQVRLAAAARIIGLHRQLTLQNHELERFNRDLFEQGRTDSLTQVGNRLRMDEDLRRMGATMTRYGHACSIAICDIDHFKSYNDTCGHPAGDGVLRNVARTIAGSTRSGDSVFRYGGEEFLLILPEQKPPSALHATNRVRTAVEALAIPHLSAPSGVVTISVGVATSAPGVSVDELVQQADHALYSAKSAGRNRVIHYQDIAVPK